MNLLLALAYWGQHKFVQVWQEMIQAIRMAEPERIIRNIYRKLGVGSRVRAVKKARELRLL